MESLNPEEVKKETDEASSNHRPKIMNQEKKLLNLRAYKKVSFSSLPINVAMNVAPLNAEANDTLPALGKQVEQKSILNKASGLTNLPKINAAQPQTINIPKIESPIKQAEIELPDDIPSLVKKSIQIGKLNMSALKINKLVKDCNYFPLNLIVVIMIICVSIKLLN